MDKHNETQPDRTKTELDENDILDKDHSRKLASTGKKRLRKEVLVPSIQDLFVPGLFLYMWNK